MYLIFLSEAQFITMMIINCILILLLIGIGISYLLIRKRKKRMNTIQFDLLARTTHDLRTPIHTIDGYATLIQNQLDNKEKVKEYLTRIQSVSKHMLSLVNDVLDFSKLEKGKMTFTKEQVNLKEVFEFCIDAISFLMTEENISLQTEFNITHSLVYLDELRLKQILLNLLSNAWKYTSNGGVISFVFQEEVKENSYSSYSFIIKDTGCGMNPEFQRHIFEPYAQEHTVNKKESTGLGLAIVKKLVEQMQGRICVESYKDQGTTFQVCFNLEYIEEVEIGLLRNTKILFVEDNFVSVELMKRFVAEADIVLDIASTGKEAISLFESSKAFDYDFILMDLVLPETDGFEATKHIRDLNRLDAKSIPILGMTAINYEYQKKVCIEAGMNMCLSKPINFKRLVQILLQYKKNNS